MKELDLSKIIFASHNAGKIEEMRQLLGPRGVEIVSAADLSLPEPDETEDSFVGNARIKAHAAAKAVGLPALSDDSGLQIEALGGAPGVWTADWAEGPGGRDFGRAMERAHRELTDIGAVEPWSARFCCTMVLAWPDGDDEIYEGTVNGRLIWPIRGAEGHGYDPMFIPDGSDKTFAEMLPSEKNKISHRARALSALIAARFT